MKKQYLMPELKLAGEADKVVLGGGGAGSDIFGEDFWDDLPYASDEDTRTER